MELRGRAHKLGDHINTDYIVSAKYKARISDIKELATHIMEDLDPEFYSRIRPGDFIVAGENFGSGSSRETAPLVIREAGIAAVLAKSFARIFFRNAINVGLPVAVCDTDAIEDGDVLRVDLARGQVINESRGGVLSIAPLPPLMQEILQDGGLEAHFKKHGGFRGMSAATAREGNGGELAG